MYFSQNWDEWVNYTCLAGIKWFFEYLSELWLWKIKLIHNNWKTKKGQRGQSPLAISETGRLTRL